MSYAKIVVERALQKAPAQLPVPCAMVQVKSPTAKAFSLSLEPVLDARERVKLLKSLVLSVMERDVTKAKLLWM